MYIWNVLVFILHLGSFFTSIYVNYKIFCCEVLSKISKIFLWTMFSSAFLTDLGYSYAVYLKMKQDSLLFVFADILESGPLSTPILLHDVGFSIFTVSILFTATERLISSKWTFSRKYPILSVLVAILLVLADIALSYFWATVLLDNRVHIYAASVAVFVYFVAIVQLFMTIRLNVRRYKSGIGEALDKRFQTASTYYFNRSLFRSLLGNVLCRLISFSCIFVITTGTYGDIGFGWLSFIYHNMVAVGNILFPPLIDFKSRNTGRGRTGVRDLTGRALTLRQGQHEHHIAMQKMWR